MIEAEHVTDLVHDNRQQIDSSGCSSSCQRVTLRVEVGVVLRCRIDEPAESGRVAIHVDDVANREAEQFARQIGKPDGEVFETG